MSHLSIDRLAALADEQPSPDESAHLAHCASCANEMQAHRSLLAIAESERGSMGLPLTRWETLSERLRREGLIVGRALDTAPAYSRWTLQIAAALLLVAGGVALGRATTSEPVLPGGITGDAPAQTTRVVTPDSLPTTFASIEDANRWKSFYSEGYQRAVSFLAQNDSLGRPVATPAVMRARLSTLDRVSKIVGEALNDAPYDPVINDFYLNSFGQREATLRQLNTVLPQNVRLNSF